MADAGVTLARWRNLLQTDGAWVAPEQEGLWSALAELDRGPREALLLRVLDGRTVGDIATILDESNGTVAFWISSARRRLESTTPNVREGLLALEAAVPTSAAAPARGRPSAIVRLGVPAAVLVVALIVGAAQLTAKPPGGDGVGAATPSVPIVSQLQWTSQAFEAGAFVSDLALDGDRLVAVGANKDSLAAIWTSADDGLTWDAIELPLSPPVKGAHAQLTHVAAHDGTIVATGEWAVPNQPAAQPQWAAWFFSPDRGAEWHEAPGLRSGVVFDLAATERGFLAVGMDFGRGTLQTWGSPDGLQWSNLPARGLPEFGAFDLHLAVFGDRLIAAGVTQEASRPRIWSTKDGSTWTSAPDAPVDQGGVNAIAASDGRVLAVGARWSSPTSSEDSTAVLWQSLDGATWNPIVLDETPGTQAGMVADGPLGAIIGGASQADDGPISWFLPPGATQAVPQPIDHFITAVVALPDRFVAIGTCAEGQDCNGQALLIGRLTGSASGPPVPSP